MAFCRIAFWLPLAVIYAAAAGGVTTTRPVGPIEYQHEVRTDPPMHLHAIIVDLTDPAVHLRTCLGGSDAKMARPWETTLMPVSAMAQRDGLFAAVNGNYFIPKSFVWLWGRKFYYSAGNWARSCGWAMANGKLFSADPANPDLPAMVVTAKGKLAIGTFEKIPGGAGEVVSGMYQLVTAGKNTAAPQDINGSKRSPRTAVGYDRERKKLIMLVVDGRRPDYSAGETIVQLGAEMIRLGCWDAISLDGGGSSTMVMRDAKGEMQVMNRPSDGHDLPLDLSVERNVANAFGVIVDGATTRPSNSN
jgi:hypothetical protein